MVFAQKRRVVILVYFAKIFRVASSFAKTNLTASLLQVNAAGGDLTYVAFFGSKTDYALFSTKDITEVKQLRGKRLGKARAKPGGIFLLFQSAASFKVVTQIEGRSVTSFRMTTPLRRHSEHPAKNLLYCDFC